METSRLKNIVLLILALVNVFLLISLSSRNADARNAQRVALEQISLLFEEAGISLHSDLTLPDTPTVGYSLTRDVAADEKFASAILGEVTRSDEGGGIYRYQGTDGTALFRSGGAFDIICNQRVDDPEAYCSKLFKAFGYRDVVLAIADGSGTITATQYFRKRPVVNATVTCSFLDFSLYSVVGHHLPSAYTTQLQAEKLSALSALNCFLQTQSELGFYGKAVLAVKPAYSLQGTPAAPLSLVPVWCIHTDTFEYYVNCATREITHN